MKVLLVSLLLFTGNNVFSQSGSRALLLGQKVPDIEFGTIVNFPAKKIRLSDFSGKLVILDFWATWCSSCINRFPKMDSLQKEFAGQLQIVLITSTIQTRDTETQVAVFLKEWKNNYVKPFNIPIVVEEATFTTDYFPRIFLPHYVWINSKGNLAAITSSEYVTKENIMKLIRNK